MSSEQLYHAFRVTSKNQDPAQRAASLHAAVSCPSFSTSRDQGHGADGQRGTTPHLPSKRSHDHISYSMHTFEGPPSSPSKEDKNGHTRLRASQACETCRIRKRKCSGQKPTCGRCSERGLKCVWSDIVPHRGQQKPRLRRVPAMSSLKPIATSESSSSDDAISPVTPVGEAFTYDSVRAPEALQHIVSPRPTHPITFVDPGTMYSSIPIADPDPTPTHEMRLDPQIKQEQVESKVLTPLLIPPHIVPSSYYEPYDAYDIPCPPTASSNGDLYASYASSVSDGPSSFAHVQLPEQQAPQVPKHTSSNLPSYPSAATTMTEYLHGGNTWMVEILDPVVGSFLNPAPMIDAGNHGQTWGPVHQDLQPEFGFFGAVMPSESPFHLNPGGSYQW